MFWSTAQNKQQKIQFNKCFSEKYIVEQSSEITMSSVFIKTVTEFRWDVRVIKITDEGYYIDVLSLDNVLKETNNPNMRDLNTFNNAFKRMYSELSLRIDKEGELLEVRNVAQIKRKWAQIKQELTEIQNNHDGLNGIIALNDTLFNSPNNILTAVRGHEFFEVFLNVYLGLSIPGGKIVKKKSLFAQEDINWGYDVTFDDLESLPEGQVQVHVKGKARQDFDRSWIKNAYGNFPIAEIADRVPEVKEVGKYKFDFASGRILTGVLSKEETVHPDFLKAKMVYSIVADNQQVVDEVKLIEDNENAHQQTSRWRKFSFSK